MAIYQWSKINNSIVATAPAKVYRTLFANLVIILKEIYEGAVDVVLVISLIICIGYFIVAPLLIHGAKKVAFKKI